MTISFQETASQSYSIQRAREVEEVKMLVKQGKPINYYQNNNCVCIGGKIFNGFTKKFIESIKEEQWAI